jgi:hypothetical protein
MPNQLLIRFAHCDLAGIVYARGSKCRFCNAKIIAWKR